MASMDEFEDRLRTYDQDLETYERLSEQKVGELAFVHLQDMIPQEVRARFHNEKHNFTKVVHLREFFRRVIEDYKSALNELVARMAEEETADSEKGFCYSPCYAMRPKKMWPKFCPRLSS